MPSDRVEKIADSLKWAIYDSLTNGSDWNMVKINIMEELAKLQEFQPNPYAKHWKEMGSMQ